MVIKLACDGRGRSRKAILDRVIELAGEDVELVLHFGDRDSDYHAPCYQRMEVRRGKRGHLMEQGGYRGANIDLIASEEFDRLVAQAIDQLHRNDRNYRYRAHNLSNLQDYLDYYHILSDAIATELVRSGATHVLFMNMPHLAYDLVLYQVARSLGLKTIILCQTIFPARFFSMSRPEDMGDLDWSAVQAPAEPIEQGTAPELFFMDDKWQKEGNTGRITPAAVWNIWKYAVLREPRKAMNPVWLAKTIRRVARIYGTLPDWRDPFAHFFHTNELAFFEHLAEYEQADVDLDVPFVYVPLHNQPEMSTSSLGGIYRDQVLMIEHLAQRLPSGWRIYVKENPRQAGYARGPMFFHRLGRIEAVQYVPSNTNTHALSSKAKFVATVSGTAGWEAIRKGRPAVVFGNSWYKSLPGCFRWSDDLDLEQVAEATFSHSDVERAYGAVLAKCHDGVIEDIYINMVDDFDRSANVETVSNAIVSLLRGNVAPTFGGADGDA